MKKLTGKRGSATVVHTVNPKTAVQKVAFGDLKVVIVKDDDGWFFAQGLDINYAAQGRTLAEVKKNFGEGLGKTIGLHIERFGTIKKLLRPAPPEAWEITHVPSARHLQYSCVKLYPFVPETAREQMPYTNIRYIESADEAA